ncbi:MAG TPA: hypothetical protein VGB52_06015 [Actinomycetota bacterium]
MTVERSPTGAEAADRIQRAEGVLEANETMSVALCSADKPWIGKVFFIEDTPEPGRLDVCCAIVGTDHNVALFSEGATVAFLAGGEEPDRWVQGSGYAEVVADDADALAIVKRLRDRSEAAARFLELLDARAVRIHVQRLTAVDLDADPPIAEFSFS